MNELRCLKITQPIGVFYITKISAKDFLNIGKIEPREYLAEASVSQGFNRGINETKVSEIADYLSQPDCTIPNSFVVNLESDDIEVIDDDNFTLLKIPKEKSNYALIIDGQHRFQGLKQIYTDQTKQLPNFEAIVTIFVDLPPYLQAEIFSIINIKQTKVNKSVVYDLFSLSQFQTPQKVAHELCLALNRTENSPLYKRIKLLGKKDDFNRSTEDPLAGSLSQGMLVEAILPLISSAPDTIKNKIHNGGDGWKKINDEAPLWENFVNDDAGVLFKILLNYFNGLKNALGPDWDDTDNALTKSIGIRALLSKDIFGQLVSIGKKQKKLNEDFFRNSFSSILNGKTFSIQHLKGGTGESTIRNTLSTQIKMILEDNS